MTSQKVKKATPESLREAKEILSHLRTPKTPSEELVSIVEKNSQVPEEKSPNIQDKVAARPSPAEPTP